MNRLETSSALGSRTTDVDRASKVSIRVVHGLLDVIEQSGGSSSAVLQALGMDIQNRADDETLPRSTVYRLCELALEETRDPALGLHWSIDPGASAFSPLSHLIAYAPTLRHALEALIQLHPLFSQQSSFRFLESDDKVTLQSFRLVGASAPAQRFAADLTVSGIYRIARLFDPHVRAHRVCFQHPAPAYRAEYAKVFERPVRFEQAFSGLVLDRCLLDTVSPHKDVDVFDALCTVARRRIWRRSVSQPLWERVRDLLVQRATSGSLEMPDIARACDTSTRTLRRRLAAEGKSYPQLLGDALSSVARELLVDEARSIQEVAWLLRFADSSSFHRAFKRWTGMTPNEYRMQAQARRGMGRS